MRTLSVPLSLVTALALSACGSTAPAPETADATPGADMLDVCALVPKATVDLLLGDARDPPNQSGRADTGTCAWKGATASEFAIVTVAGSGTDAQHFGETCASGSPPFPMLSGLGLGVAACGRFEPGGGGNLWIQLDATTTVIGVYATMGTQDQALAVLRDLASRLDR